MKQTPLRCRECHAAWTGENGCQEALYQMSAWELENPALGIVHHLMVLCYHLQHPSMYSPQGLDGARHLLVDFLKRGVTPRQVRQRDGTKLDSSRRTYKIKGTSTSHGEYSHPVAWQLTAVDVIAGGRSEYITRVRDWAQAVYADLESSENLSPNSTF